MQCWHRPVIATLDGMRDKIEKDDIAMVTTAEQKESTLVFEWSGANDLITVNEHPTIEAAERAVKARKHNLEKMISMGYKHFILFNLPDLSLTPRFQAQHEHIRQVAHISVQHFNQCLIQQIQSLIDEHPQCSIAIYDVNQLFTNAYHNPEVFGLEEEKKHTPFIKSKDFEDTDNQKPAKGFMFWDEVHPTEAVHK